MCGVAVTAIGVAEPSIVEASEADLEGVLKLQYLCYQTEAKRYDFYGIPALTQTLDSLREDLHTQVLLVVKLGDEVIGSVRGKHADDHFHIGRLVVHPRVQRQGLGSRLLAAIEERAGDVPRFELFTGHRSEEFLGVYHKSGYRECRTEEVSPTLTVVYLDKTPGEQP